MYIMLMSLHVFNLEGPVLQLADCNRRRYTTTHASTVFALVDGSKTPPVQVAAGQDHQHLLVDGKK